MAVDQGMFEKGQERSQRIPDSLAATRGWVFAQSLPALIISPRWHGFAVAVAEDLIGWDAGLALIGVSE